MKTGRLIKGGKSAPFTNEGSRLKKHNRCPQWVEKDARVSQCPFSSLPLFIIYTPANSNRPYPCFYLISVLNQEKARTAQCPTTVPRIGASEAHSGRQPVEIP